MKKIIMVVCLLTLVLSIMAFISRNVPENSNFEGVITYSQFSQLSGDTTRHTPSTFKIYFKGGKTKEIHVEPCGITTSVSGSNSSVNGKVTDSVMKKESIITDRNAPDEPIDLEEIKGNKYRVMHDKIKKSGGVPVIKYTNDTKQISGYPCKKVEMILIRGNGDSITYDVYYNEAIKDSGLDIKGLKGLRGLKWLPLEISGNISMMGREITMTTIAVKIDMQPISDDEFKVPPGYKVVTEAEYEEDVSKILNGGGN